MGKIKGASNNRFKHKWRYWLSTHYKICHYLLIVIRNALKVVLNEWYYGTWYRAGPLRCPCTCFTSIYVPLMCIQVSNHKQGEATNRTRTRGWGSEKYEKKACLPPLPPERGYHSERFISISTYWTAAACWYKKTKLSVGDQLLIQRRVDDPLTRGWFARVRQIKKIFVQAIGCADVFNVR